MRATRSFAALLALLFSASAGVGATSGETEETGDHGRVTDVSCVTLTAIVTPSEANLTVGSPAPFTATVDCDGQDVTSNSVIKWAVVASAQPIGTVDPQFGASTKFTPTADGKGGLMANVTYNLTATQGFARINVTSSGTVNCPFLTATIQPPGANLAVGQKQRFMAEAWCQDQTGNKTNVTQLARFDWGVQSAGIIGNLSAAQGPMTEFTATMNGNGNLTLQANHTNIIAKDFVPLNVGAVNTCKNVTAVIDQPTAAAHFEEPIMLHGHAICEAVDVGKNSNFTWKVVSGSATVSPVKGNVTQLTGTAVGPVSVTMEVAFNAQTTSSTLVLDILPPRLDATITPASVTLLVGDTQKFIGEARRLPAGTPVPATLTWRILPGPSVGTIDASGLFTAFAPGDATVELTAVWMGGTARATAKVSVSPIGPPTISVAPLSRTLTVGEKATFTASVMDAKGNPLTIKVNWTVDSRIGSGIEVGLDAYEFTAESPGQGQLVAAFDGPTGEISAPATITVVPSPYILVTGRVTDEGGSPVVGAKVEALDISKAVVNSTSTDSSGSFAMWLPRGDYTLRITHPSFGESTQDITAGQDPGVEVKAILKPGNRNPGSPGILPLIGIGAGVGALFLLFAAVASEGIFFALALLPILFYTRLRREKMLDQFTRGQIFGYIMANPGSSYRSIKRGLGLNNGTLTYHLYTLEREKFLRSRTEGVYKRFYPIDVRIPDDGGEEVTPFQRRLWNLINEEQGISQTEAAERL
ncbi:MAG TPA: carboxypeptidase regulatory-like domain-containing protein, partial [Thermoplasmata archaeon]|nr:carboxypeptidase regulatory-like domain-containing protein [Thermoplasmata archaeon]